MTLPSLDVMPADGSSLGHLPAPPLPPPPAPGGEGTTPSIEQPWPAAGLSSPNWNMHRLSWVCLLLLNTEQIPQASVE